MSDKEKNAFYCECQEKAGTELHFRMQETIHDSSSKKSIVNFGSSGIFIDEWDLNEKYTRKPEQLASIKANTRTMQCPVRKVKLYEDPEFKLTVDDTETNIQEKKRKANQRGAWLLCQRHGLRLHYAPVPHAKGMNKIPSP